MGYELRSRRPCWGGHWNYWLKHLSALHEKVKDACRRAEAKRPFPVQDLTVAKELEKIDEELGRKQIDPIPDAARKIWAEVKSTLDKIDAEVLLKYVATRQMMRLESQMAFEAKAGRLLPNGHKNIDSLRSMGDSLLKLEMGRKLMKGVGGAMQAIDVEPKNEMVQELEKFDVVDRNLLRELGMQVIKMIEDGSNGRYKVGGLEAYIGEEAARPPADAKNSDPDVS